MKIEPPLCVKDLCDATKLNEKTVKKLILDGQLPGQRVGDKRNARWLIPHAAFVAWCEGRWQPRQKPEPLFPDGPPPQMLRSKAS